MTECDGCEEPVAYLKLIYDCDDRGLCRDCYNKENDLDDRGGT